MKKLMWWLVLPVLCAGGCVHIDAREGTRHADRRPSGDPLTIVIDAFAQSASEPNLYEGHWFTHGRWPHPVGYVQFEIRDGNRSERWYGIHLDDLLRWRALDRDATEESVTVRWQRPAGVLVLEGRRSFDTAGGKLTFEPNTVYAGELAGLFGARPDEREWLALALGSVDLEYARQVRQALADELTIETLLGLNSHHVAAAYIRGSRDAGYAFSAEQLIRLTSYHIPLEMLRGFKQAGYSFSVEQFIRIRNYHLEVEDFTEFRRAGYDFSIDEMIRAKNYRVPVETARAVHAAGLHYDLDQIIKLVNYRVSPDYLLAFRRAGYELSLDEVIKAKNYHVDADDAARLKALGYDFSLDDLIKLRNYHVPVEFMVQVHDPQYENFTAQELIDFRQKHISAETINKIRTARQKMQP